MGRHRDGVGGLDEIVVLVVLELIVLVKAVVWELFPFLFHILRPLQMLQNVLSGIHVLDFLQIVQSERLGLQLLDDRLLLVRQYGLWTRVLLGSTCTREKRGFRYSDVCKCL